MSSLPRLFVIFLLTIATATIGYLPTPNASTPSVQAAENPIGLDFTQNAHGDIAAIGNVNMTCPSNNANCPKARDADPLAPTVNGYNNNDWDTRFSLVNTDPGAGFKDSSSAQLAIPANATILKANLYWTGYTQDGLPNPQVPIKFRTPASNSYTTIQSKETKYAYANDHDRYWRGKADVTSLVAKAGAGNYYLADLSQYTTVTINQGIAGAWTLIVAFSSQNEIFRNLSIFDGMFMVEAGGVSSNSVYAGVQGFQTPLSGKFEAKVGFAILDGDRGSSDKGIGIAPHSGACNADSQWSNLQSNQLNPANDFYNSTISYLGQPNSYGGGTRNPNYSNTMALDIDTFSVNHLSNNSTGACFKFGTDGEGVMPFAIFSAIQIDTVPKKVAVEKAYKEGEEVPIDIQLNRPDATGPVGTGIELSIAVDTSGSTKNLNDIRDKLQDFLSSVLASGSNVTISLTNIGRVQAGCAGWTDKVTMPPTVISTSTIDTIRSHVNNFQSACGDDIASGISAAVSKLWQSQTTNPDAKRYLVIITDGMVSGPSDSGQCAIDGNKSATFKAPPGTITQIITPVTSGRVVVPPREGGYGHGYMQNHALLNQPYVDYLPVIECKPYYAKVRQNVEPGITGTGSNDVVRGWKFLNDLAAAYNAKPVFTVNPSANALNPQDSDVTLNSESNTIDITLDTIANTVDVGRIVVNDELNPSLFSSVVVKGIYNCTTGAFLYSDGITSIPSKTEFNAAITKFSTFPICLRVNAKIIPEITDTKLYTQLWDYVNTDPNKPNKNYVEYYKTNGELIGQRIPIDQTTVKLQFPPPKFELVNITQDVPLSPMSSSIGTFVVHYLNLRMWLPDHQATVKFAKAVQGAINANACQSAVSTNHISATLAKSNFKPSGSKYESATTVNITSTSQAQPGTMYTICLELSGNKVGSVAVEPVARYATMSIKVVANPWIQVSLSNNQNAATGDVFTNGAFNITMPQSSPTTTQPLFRQSTYGVSTTTPKANNALSDITRTTVANRDWLTNNYSVPKDTPLDINFEQLSGQVKRIMGNRPTSDKPVGCQSSRADLVDAAIVETDTNNGTITWNTKPTCPMFIQIGGDKTTKQNLRFDSDPNFSDQAPVIFLVKGDIEIKSTVSTLTNVILIWNGGFNDAYNITTSSRSEGRLVIKGSLISLAGSTHGFNRPNGQPGLRRNYVSSGVNNTQPAEVIEYQPQLLITLARLFEGFQNIINWNESGQGPQE